MKSFLIHCLQTGYTVGMIRHYSGFCNILLDCTVRNQDKSKDCISHSIILLNCYLYIAHKQTNVKYFLVLFHSTCILIGWIGRCSGSCWRGRWSRIFWLISIFVINAIYEIVRSKEKILNSFYKRFLFLVF